MKRNGGVQNQATLSTPSSGTDQASNAQNFEDEYNAQLSTTAPGRVETLQIADNLSNSPIEDLRDEPDFDFYVEASWLTWIVIFTLCSVCTVSICIIAYTALGDQMAQWILYPNSVLWWTWTLFSIPLNFWFFVLFVISFEDLGLQIRESRARDLLFTSANCVLSLYFLFQLVVYGVGLPIFGALSSTSPLSWLFVVIPVELYLVVAGLRAGMTPGFLLVLFVGALFLVPMLCPLSTAL